MNHDNTCNVIKSGSGGAKAKWGAIRLKGVVWDESNYVSKSKNQTWIIIVT